MPSKPNAKNNSHAHTNDNINHDLSTDKLTKSRMNDFTSKRSKNNILSNYVKKNALFAISLAVLGLWVLQIVFSYLGELDALADDYTMSDALMYIFYKSPYFLEQFIPTGALLGAVVGLGLLANHSELIVMRAGGVSNMRIVSWVMQPAILFVLLALSINQFVLPKTNHLADMVGKSDTGNIDVLSVEDYWSVQPLYNSYQTNQSTNKANHQANIETNSQINDEQIVASAIGKEVIHIHYADTTGKISGVKRWQLDELGNLLSVSTAAKGDYIGIDFTAGDDNKKFNKQDNTIVGEVFSIQTFSKQAVRYQWQMQDVNYVRLDSNANAQATQLAQAKINLPIEPESVYLLTKDPEDLSLTQLLAHHQFMQSQNKRSMAHELAFWQKLLSPFAILSLVIIACSFVFGSLRTYSLGSRVVLALLFGLFFSYMQDLAGFMALATEFSPFIMVLTPIILCALTGFYLLQRQQ